MPRYKKELTDDEIIALKDENIDYSDIPELGDWFWDNAEIRPPVAPKKQLTIRLDEEIVDWFKAQGKGYQTRMNAVLRSYYESQHK